MIRALPLLTAALLMVSTIGAHAGGAALAGKTIQSPETGLPFCTSQVSLAMYILYGLKHDGDSMKAMTDCAMFKGGLTVNVLEDLDNDSKLGHVVKVRVFSPTKVDDAAEGYTLSFVLDDR